jgi:hypothetical protein
MKRRPSIVLLLYLLVLVPPLAMFVLLQTATALHRPRPIKTGDAILDAYLEASVDHGRLRNVADPVNNTYGNMNPRPLPEFEWLAWEQCFGQDPRFYMFCYNLRNMGEGWQTTQRRFVTSDGMQYLEQARERRITDWSVLLRYYKEIIIQWHKEASPYCKIQPPSSSAPVAEKVAYNQERMRQVDNLHGAEYHKLLVELAAAGADQAQVQYRLARIAADRGDQAETLRRLDAGNRAAHNDDNAGAPFDELKHFVPRNRGERILRGYLVERELVVPVESSKPIKEFIDEQIMHSSGAERLPCLHRLYLMACDTGSIEGTELINCSIGISCVRKILKVYKEERPNTPPEVQRDLAQAYNSLASIRRTLQRVSQQQNSRLMPPPKYSDTLLSVLVYPIKEEEQAFVFAEDWQRCDEQWLAAKQAADLEFAKLRRLKLWD